MSLKIETRTFVNDCEASQLSNDQLLDALAKAEKRKAELAGFKAGSKYIRKEIADLDAGIAKLVAILDARVPADTETEASE